MTENFNNNIRQNDSAATVRISAAVKAREKSERRARTREFITTSLHERKYLLFCFFIPMVLLMLIYAAMETYPFGESSVLVLDLNAQYVYFFEGLRDIIREGGSFLYSFKRALGGEFLGMYDYYLASPFSYIIALFPKEGITEALFTMFLLKCGSCGLTFGIYIEATRKRSRTATVMFSVMYALCAYAIVMQHNTMWTDNLILLPLVMLGIENLIKYGRYKLFVISLAIAVISNFYIGYMMCIFAAIYFFIYYLSKTPSERNPLGQNAHFSRALGRMTLFSVIAVCIAALAILSAYYSLSFGKTGFSDPSYAFEQKFDFFDMFTKFYFGSYDTVRPEGLPFLYSGMMTLILVPLYFIAPHINAREKIGSALMLVLLTLSFNGSTIDLIWHGFQKPNWLNYRYSFIFCFFLVLLAYKAFERIEDIGIRAVTLSVSAFTALLLVLQKLDYENMPDLLCVWGSIGFMAVYVLAIYGYIRIQKNDRLQKLTGDTVNDEAEDTGTAGDTAIAEKLSESATASAADSTPDTGAVADTAADAAADTVTAADAASAEFERREYRSRLSKRISAVIGYESGQKILAIIICLEMLCGGIANLVALDSDVVISSRTGYREFIDKYHPVVQKIEELDDSFYRMEKTTHRKTNDNFALGINGVSNSTSTLNASVVTLLNKLGIAAKSHWSEYAGGNPVFDSLFGMKYLICESKEERPLYEKVFDYDSNNDKTSDLTVYKNPEALSIAYGVSPAIEVYDLLSDSEITPFERLNLLVNYMTGETTLGEDIFVPAKVYDTKTQGSKVSQSSGHTCYEPITEGSTGSVTYTVEITSTDRLYCYFPSDYPKVVDLYVNSVKRNTYFDGHTHVIYDVGSYTVGQRVEVKLQFSDTKMYIENGADYFCYLDSARYAEVMNQLDDHQYNITNYSDDHFEGTISVDEKNCTVFTTIPYDEGWNVYANGEKVEIFETLDSLMAFRLAPGDYELEMKYLPKVIVAGALISVGGIAAFAGIWTAESYKKRKKRYAEIASEEAEVKG